MGAILKVEGGVWDWDDIEEEECDAEVVLGQGRLGRKRSRL